MNPTDDDPHAQCAGEIHRLEELLKLYRAYAAISGCDKTHPARIRLGKRIGAVDQNRLSFDDGLNYARKLRDEEEGLP